MLRDILNEQYYAHVYATGRQLRWKREHAIIESLVAMTPAVAAASNDAKAPLDDAGANTADLPPLGPMLADTARRMSAEREQKAAEVEGAVATLYQEFRWAGMCVSPSPPSPASSVLCFVLRQPHAPSTPQRDCV